MIAGLSDPSARVRRAALVALDQMHGGNLTPEMVTPLLGTDDPILRQTVLDIVAKHSGWAQHLTSWLSARLAQKSFAESDVEQSRGVLLAFAKDSEIQSLVAAALSDSTMPPGTQRLLLEVVAECSVDPLPPDWAASLGRCLESQDPSVVRQTIAAIEAHGITQYDAEVLALADQDRWPIALRISAARAIVPRLPKVDRTLFDFLFAQLERETPALERLATASCLGLAKLSDDQLAKLCDRVAQAGAMELPQLIGAYQGSSNAGVAQQLITALKQSPGLPNLSTATLDKILFAYPQDVRQAGRALRAQFDVGEEQMRAKIDELEPLLAGGNAQRGQQLFFGQKAACFACHAVGAEGGHVGPDLSKIGAIRSQRDLLTAIVFPSASFARGFEPYVITTESGKVFGGVIRSETADALRLTTGDRSEIRIPRSEIDEIVPSKTSVMPDGFANQLSRQELTDVIAFLATMR